MYIQNNISCVFFYCTDPAYSSCLAPEEQWSEPEDSQEFVESPYVPGSIVWAKMDGYPWLVVARLMYTLLLHVMYGLPPHTHGCTGGLP